MATRATIWQKKPDGYRGVYLHWSGSPLHAGKILADHYNTEEKIDGLLDSVFKDSKYLSSLSAAPEKCIYNDDVSGGLSWMGVHFEGERLEASGKCSCEYQYEYNGVGWWVTDVINPTRAYPIAANV